MIEKFAGILKDRIASGLPGIEAQRRMAPASRMVQEFKPEQFPGSRKGAVLILLYPHKSTIYTALIKRPDYEGVHSGQISFPGGKMEITDPDAAHTALREAQEEIGIVSNDVVLIGKLSDLYIPPSNFFVFPFVGYCSYRPVFIPDPVEVEKVIEMPLRILLDQSIKSEFEFMRGTEKIIAPCYIINNYTVWGATAIMLSEFEQLLSEEILNA